MKTITQRWDDLVAHFKETPPETLPVFRRVEKLPIQVLIDDTFWSSLQPLSVPALYIVLKKDTDEGVNTRNDSTWALLIVAPTKPTRRTEDAETLIEYVRTKLDHAFPDSKLYLTPNSMVTWLQVMPQMATVEVEVYTTDFD